MSKRNKEMKNTSSKKEINLSEDLAFLDKMVDHLERALLLSDLTISGTDYGIEFFCLDDDTTTVARRVSFYGVNKNGENAVNTYYVFLNGSIQFVLEDIIHDGEIWWSHPSSFTSLDFNK